ADALSGSQRTGGYRAARRRHERSVGREAGGGHERTQPRGEFRDVAAIAKTRAANNINQSAGDIITDEYGNVGNRHRNTAAVSAGGQNANVGRDHETGVNAASYSGNLVGNHGIGTTACG